MLSEWRYGKVFVFFAFSDMLCYMNKFLFFFEKLVNWRNEFGSLCVAEYDIAIWKVLAFFGESLWHTAGENNNSVRIFTADTVENLAVFCVTYGCYRTAVNDCYVCPVPVIREKKSVLQHIFTHCLWFILINLAAECNYIKIHSLTILFWVNSWNCKNSLIHCWFRQKLMIKYKQDEQWRWDFVFCTGFR